MLNPRRSFLDAVLMISIVVLVATATVLIAAAANSAGITDGVHDGWLPPDPRFKPAP